MHYIFAKFTVREIKWKSAFYVSVSTVHYLRNYSSLPLGLINQSQAPCQLDISCWNMLKTMVDARCVWLLQPQHKCGLARPTVYQVLVHQLVIRYGSRGQHQFSRQPMHHNQHTTNNTHSTSKVCHSIHAGMLHFKIRIANNFSLLPFIS